MPDYRLKRFYVSVRSCQKGGQCEKRSFLLIFNLEKLGCILAEIFKMLTRSFCNISNLFFQE